MKTFMQQLILHAIPLYFVVYVYYRLLKRLPGPRWISLALVLVLTLGSQYVALARYNLYGLGQSLPYALWSVWGFFYNSFVLLALLTLIFDAVQLLAYWRHKNLNQHLRLGALLVLILGFALGLLGHQQALREPPVKAFNVYIDDLPPQFEGFTIAQLSDVHISALFNRDTVKALVKQTNQLNADIITVTGDLLDGQFATLQSSVEPLTHLKAKEGVYVVEGNHEHYYDYDHWIAYFRDQPWFFLQNESHCIERGPARMSIIGLTDPMAKRYHREEPDIEKALKKVQPEDVKILLSHQVKQTRQWANKDIDLQLSGHTHGGQILGMTLLASHLNDGFVSGLYKVGHLQLYVNPGTFLWYGSPVRLGVPSEISLITLLPSKANKPVASSD